MKEKDALGLVQVYTGEGKGKTTAALGLAFRAAGHGIRVHIIQFMKMRPDTGEMKSAQKLAPQLTIRQFGRPGFIRDGGPTPKDLALAREGFQEAKVYLDSQPSGILILDEIGNALRYNLISVEEVLALIAAKPAGLELILTGRGIPGQVQEAADLVTEMKEIKHPYQKGIGSRKGIEY